jgi:hypothetical protein
MQTKIIIQDQYKNHFKFQFQLISSRKQQFMNFENATIGKKDAPVAALSLKTTVQQAVQ